MNLELGLASLGTLLMLLACSDDDQLAGGSTQGGSPQGGGLVAGNGQGAGEPQGGAPSGTFVAVHDTLCAPEALIGRVLINGIPAIPYVVGYLWDQPDPLVGPPELENESCAFYRYQDGGCGTCATGDVCNYEGQCVSERRTIKNGTLVVSAGDEQLSLSTDPELGGISGELTIGDIDSQFAMTLSWGELTVELPPMPYPTETLVGVDLTFEGSNEMPGALDASWEPPAGGGHVLTTIDINHHAAVPTFTFCAVPAASGALHADAAMIDPLAVITGLEFQGLEYLFVAAADTPYGCVEFRHGGGP